MVVEEMQEITEGVFKAYVRPLNSVASFKYLSRTLTDSDDDWTAVAGNLRKVRKIWVWLLIILGQERDNLLVLVSLL